MSNKKEVSEVREQWNVYETYLVRTRYSIRNPKTGEPLENSYNDVISRVIGYLLDQKNSSIVNKNSSSHEDIESLVSFLRKRIIIPATPVLMSFGNPYTRRKGFFSCYPLGYVEDSMEGIRKICEKMEIIYMHGGGCGIDISKLRPKGSLVDSGQGISSGPIGFLYKFDAITGTTNQGGRRRGALLVQMNWNHPDIKDFIKAKAAVPEISELIYSLPKEIRPEQNPLLSNMNISINVFGDFWKEDKLINLIATQMWRTGDPGLLFIDNMKSYSPFKSKDEPIFSNPCGEYLAPANTACNLITINLAVLAQSAYNFKTKTFDFKKFFTDILHAADKACILGNILIDSDEGYPINEIKEATQYFRPIGIGITGFHTALIYAFNGDVKYGDGPSIDFAERVQSILTIGALARSAELALKNKICYEWNGEYLNLHLKELKESLKSIEDEYTPTNLKTSIDLVEKCALELKGFYNAALTSQAPTGTTSAFAHVAGDTGIEPMFSINLKRKVRDFKEGWISVEVITQPLFELISKFEDVKDKVKDQLAHKISPEKQLTLMSAFQKFVHTGVSKTINVPYETTIEGIETLIKRAKDLRLKGFTVYRDGCRLDSIYVSQKPKFERKPLSEELPIIRPAKVYEVHGPVSAYVTTSFDEENRLREVFVNVGKAGTTLNSMFQAVGRLISVALRRYPDLVDRFIETMEGIESGEFYTCNEYRAHSLPDMLAKIMRDALKITQRDREEKKNKGSGDLCPNCGNLAMYRSGGCKTCDQCGYSTC